MPDEQKKARFCAFICSTLYLALFFLSFYIIIFIPNLFGNPEIGDTTGLLLVFLSLLAPLSIVVSIGLIWNRYLNQDYKNVYFACLIPLATALVVIVLMKLIQILFL